MMSAKERKSSVLPTIIAVVVSMVIFMTVPRIVFAGMEDSVRLNLYKQLIFAIPCFILPAQEEETRSVYCEA